MARGLSDNQKAILAYLATKLDHDPVWLEKRDALWRTNGQEPPPLWDFPKGFAGQRELHKHLLDTTGKDVSDGNLSRLCSALARRGLVRRWARGGVRLTQYADTSPSRPL